MDEDFSRKLFSLENSVFKLLPKVCSKDEPIMRDYLLSGELENQDNRKLIADFYLPEGCKTLDWEPNTVIEVKAFLLTKSFEDIFRLCDYFTGNVVVISLDTLPIWSTDPNFSGRFDRVQFISFESFKSKCFDFLKSHPDSYDDEERVQTPNNNVNENVEESQSQITPAEDLAKNAYNEGNITLFLGAGVSIDAGLPTWDKLLQNLLIMEPHSVLKSEDYPALSVGTFNSPIITARFILSSIKDCNSSKNAGSLLESALYKDYDPQKKSNLIEAIVDVCERINKEGVRLVTSIVTFNYDDLVEEELSRRGIPNQSVYDSSRYDGDKIPVIHVHGILKRNKINTLPVLSEESYHNLYENFNNWSNIEIVHALYRNTCIFIGLSLSDPNLRRLLESVRKKSEENKFHYAILPIKSLADHNWDAANFTRYYKMSAQKEDMFRHIQDEIYRELGIKVLWYPDGEYQQIPIILRNIAGLNHPNDDDSRDINDTSNPRDAESARGGMSV